MVTDGEMRFPTRLCRRTTLLLLVRQAGAADVVGVVVDVGDMLHGRSALWRRGRVSEKRRRK
jgi:hypothetical protein